MKHTDFLKLENDLKERALNELKLAVEAHCVMYRFYNPLDSDIDIDAPEVNAYEACWGGDVHSYFVSHVEINDDKVAIFGCRIYDNDSDTNEVEIVCSCASDIESIIDYIDETESLSDVSVKHVEPIDPFAAIHKFVFYGWNFKSVEIDVPHGKVYAPEFIAKVKWTCPTAHMYSKWVNAYKVADCSGALVQFYANLDSDNRHAFVDWILNNY